MTIRCLELALTIMNSTEDKSIRLGYNSPGALASVNHLHLHLLCLPQELYVDFVVSLVLTCRFKLLLTISSQDLKQIASNLYKLHDPGLPVKAFCLISNDVETDALKLQKLVDYCCQKTIPHNIFFTKSRSNELRVFFFPRTLGNFGAEKLYTSFLNVAFCELSGYVPIGDEELYETIDESYILERFSQEIQDICDKIEGDFVEILKTVE